VRADSGNPLFLAIRTVAAGLIVAVEVTAVVLLLDRFGTIAGWRAPEVALLFGLAFGAAGQRDASAIDGSASQVAGQGPCARCGALRGFGRLMYILQGSPVHGWI
jgi:hypothetical protein